MKKPAWIAAAFLIICAPCYPDDTTTQGGAKDYDWETCINAKKSSCINACTTSEDIECGDQCATEASDKCSSEGLSPPN